MSGQYVAHLLGFPLKNKIKIYYISTVKKILSDYCIILLQFLKKKYQYIYIINYFWTDSIYKSGSMILNYKIEVFNKEILFVKFVGICLKKIEIMQ